MTSLNVGGASGADKAVMRRILVLLVIAMAASAAVFVSFRQWNRAQPESAYRFAKVDRGDIVAMVNATGTVNPITTVIVGSQLSGQVVEILADYNSEVRANQVVARLNSDQIRARLDAARADLAQMRANKLVQEAQVDRARADIERGRAAETDAEAQVARNEALLGDAEANFKRQSALRAQGYGMTAEATFETARAQRDAQLAAVNSARAQLASAKAQLVGYKADLRVAESQVAAVTAQITQREAVVRQIEVDLRNTEIRSPVDGVVVQRNVELGQTVAASLQSPTLFLIADDLRHMEIAANIDETDVGRVRTGQRASFTVTAYPGRTFSGTVKQVRLGSQTVQNVVIYTTIIAVENPRRELMPGMTANLRVETDRRDGVLRVPNAALRWRPPTIASETTPVADAEPSPSPRGGRAGTGGSPAVVDMIDALKAAVGLTPEQLKEIDAALAEARNAFAGTRPTDGIDPTVRRQRSRAARVLLEGRVSAVLTPDQRQKFDELRRRFDEARRTGQTGRVFVLGDDRKPQPVAIRIGASDGVTTEIVSGAIESGRDVIVGGGPRTVEAPRPTTFGPRFGL